MELLQYIRLFRKWLWLIVLCSVLAGGAAFISGSRQEDLYRARVTMAVGNYYYDPNPQSYEIKLGADLAQTYVFMARNYAVLVDAINARNFNMSPGALASTITARVVKETSLIEIVVTHADPILAVNIADEVANQLILKSPGSLTPEQESLIEISTSEIEKLREQLDQSRLRLADVENQLDAATELDDVERLTEQYNTITNQIIQASATIANYQDTISQVQATNVIEVFEEARLVGLLPNSATRNTVVAVIVGAALALGVALLVEYLDDSIRTPEQANQLLDLPTIAAIPKFGRRRDDYSDRLIAYRNPDSPSAEEYRTLRTNLLYAMNGKQVTYLVTSAGPSEGKTITVANLAVAMAAAGWRVLLIDADLRRPRLHDVFNLENHTGLSSLLSLDPHETVYEQADGRFVYAPEVQECIKETDVPGLSVITSGHIPLNPAEVLGSASMQRWFEHFVAVPDIEIILFDTPPVLIAADSVVLASVIEVPVVLVIEAGQTRPNNAIRAKERLQTLNVNIKGLVLNAISSRDLSYYGSYYYYYYKSTEQVRRPAQD
ncbi:MAG: polysaccharide biosynthesis tyrosine autokinase [Anaerolineae bacterium]|nr:polysaccharide biosynthesis tyrosine autokinase [Anaerolineae bacterium]